MSTPYESSITAAESLPADLDQTTEQPGSGSLRRLRLSLPLVIGGALLVIVGSLLSWSLVGGVLGDLSINFWPAPLQMMAMALAVAGIIGVLTTHVGPLAKLGRWLDAAKGLRALSVGLVVYLALVGLAIGQTTGSILNVNPGYLVALVGSILMLVGAFFVPHHPTGRLHALRLPDVLEILIIVGGMAALLYAVAYGLKLTDAWEFSLFVVFIAALAAMAAKSGLLEWVGVMGQRHRRVLMLAAFVVVLLFPFTQDGSDTNMSIALQVLIFAGTALGLNIVVGLAGLLDLGYIAFLGAGAYVGATFSGATASYFDIELPFIVVMALGSLISAILGLIIGSPTLRVSGDYLAIVTLAFGEIFQKAVNNLDEFTGGPNGIPGVPDLTVFGFDFGESHEIFGYELTRFGNYFLLMLLIIAIIIFVFTRLANSRIGRGWIAIREDEKAAEAMGVNVFGLKLLAFAGGAALAGMAGTVKAHTDRAVLPDSYNFLESAFLLAAVVLGGMGLVSGVLVGALLLKLLPEKLRFVEDYRLLIFGALLVLMMRFRPEGLVASRRRALEFHEDDQGMAEEIDRELAEERA